MSLDKPPISLEEIRKKPGWYLPSHISGKSLTEESLNQTALSDLRKISLQGLRVLASQPPSPTLPADFTKTLYREPGQPTKDNDSLSEQVIENQLKEPIGFLVGYYRIFFTHSRMEWIKCSEKMRRCGELLDAALTPEAYDERYYPLKCELDPPKPTYGTLTGHYDSCDPLVLLPPKPRNHTEVAGINARIGSCFVKEVCYGDTTKMQERFRPYINYGVSEKPSGKNSPQYLSPNEFRLLLQISAQNMVQHYRNLVIEKESDNLALSQHRAQAKAEAEQAQNPVIAANTNQPKSITIGSTIISPAPSLSPESLRNSREQQTREYK